MINNKIIQIASNTKFYGLTNNFTHSAFKKNKKCGDTIKIEILLKKNNFITMRYETESCVFCQASVNLLSKKIINMNSDKAFDLCNDAINFYKSKENKMIKKLGFLKKILTKNNYSRKECLLLPFETLRRGLRSDYGKN